MGKHIWRTACAVGLAVLAATGAWGKAEDKVSVSLAISGSGTLQVAPASLQLAADAVAKQQNHPVVRVDFYQGATLIGSTTTAPFTLAWNGVPAGNYSLTATAINDKGDQAVAAPVAVNVDAPPTVSLTSPTAGQVAIAPAAITVTANAADSDGSVAKVEFYQGATLIGTATAAPYSVTWNNAPAGSYSLTAKATDNQGATTTSAPVTITVDAPPTVALTSPTSGQAYVAPATITVTANAADSDGSVAKVEFYQGSTLIGTATAAPYSVTWNNTPAGSYSLTAKATDNQGATTTSAPVTVTVDAPPTVSLTSPTSGQAYIAPATITVTANAADSDGTVAKVEFYQGATLIGTATAAPYSVTWNNAPAGSYSLTAKATDNQGAATTSAPVAITVDAPPTVNLTSPTSSQAYIAPATITLTANAADSDGSVAKVEFYKGTTLIGTATAAPYSVTWNNAPAGSYSLTAKATDDQGAMTASAPVTITVLPNQLPSITLLTPTAGQGFTAPATISLTASAGDADGQVVRVEYYQGNTLIGSAATSPYAASWANVPAGNYSLKAKAIDNGGGETWSSSLAVNVAPAGTQVFYLHSDQLNTPRLVTDAQGRVVWRNAPLSEPFGMSPPEEDPDGDGQAFTFNLRFPGQYFNKETNLAYNYYRDYDPATGRYIQSDPIGLKGGINTYSYVEGNPVSYTDPLGLKGGCSTGSKPDDNGICRPDPSEDQNSKVCVTPECVAGLLPQHFPTCEENCTAVANAACTLAGLVSDGAGWAVKKACTVTVKQACKRTACNTCEK